MLRVGPVSALPHCAVAQALRTIPTARLRVATTTARTAMDHARWRAVMSDNPRAGSAIPRLDPSTLQRALYDECITAGWDPDFQLSFAEEIAHLHEEVSEAFRAIRRYHDFEVHIDDDGKPQGVPIELADVLIGLFYNAELHDFDLLEAVAVKHEYNLRRSYTAEGRQLHAPSDGAVHATNAPDRSRPLRPEENAGLESRQ